MMHLRTSDPAILMMDIELSRSQWTIPLTDCVEKSSLYILIDDYFGVARKKQSQTGLELHKGD